MLSSVVVLAAAVADACQQQPVPTVVWQPVVGAAVVLMNALAVAILAQVRRNGGKT